MKIVFATTNNAKYELMKEYLIGLNIELLCLNDFDIDFPEVDENGSTPLENARIKARAYYNILRMPLFSCDSGLYFGGISEELQPGVKIRRVNEKNLNDDEMIEYYSSMAKTHGGKLISQYLNAICFVVDDNTCYEHMGDDISFDKFFIVDTPHLERNEGFPLDSLSVDIASNTYWYDLEEGTDNISNGRDGFRKFFKTRI